MDRVQVIPTLGPPLGWQGLVGDSRREIGTDGFWQLHCRRGTRCDAAQHPQGKACLNFVLCRAALEKGLCCQEGGCRVPPGGVHGVMRGGVAQTGGSRREMQMEEEDIIFGCRLWAKSSPLPVVHCTAHTARSDDLRVRVFSWTVRDIGIFYKIA